MDLCNVHQKYHYLESMGLLLTLRVKTLLQFPPGPHSSPKPPTVMLQQHFYGMFPPPRGDEWESLASPFLFK